MIDFLDRMLRQLLLDRVDQNLAIRFDPPDEDWRTTNRPADRNSLNVYLADIRENRRLRSNERTRSITAGDVDEEPSARRIDCHYLISAWSPAKVTPAIEPVLDEHALLHRVASVFANTEPLVAAEVFSNVALPPGFPASLIDAELPVTLLPPEGFIKLPEFWGTMGEKQALKPVVYVLVTVPLLLEAFRAGPMVTTRLARFRFADVPGAGEDLIEIGAQVLDAATPLPDGSFPPMPGIWVELLDLSGNRLQLVLSDQRGRFTFSNLRRSDYQLRAAALGFPVLTRPVSVPAPSGEYDLVFK